MRWVLALVLALAALPAAADLVVYDDALRNGFVAGYSYGGGSDLGHAVTTRNGSPAAIAFTGNNFNALAFPNETSDFSTGVWSGVRFYVHGGASGGQQLRFQLYNNLGGATLVDLDLDPYVAGGAIAANEWRLVEVRFAQLPVPFSGTFDRFDLQADGASAQSTLYIDDVSLIGSPATVFSDGFEGGAFRGANVVGMEMNYADYPQATGPIGGTHYPLHDTRLIDYYAGKGMGSIRLLFSWEAMQPNLMGPIPGAAAGNYRLYYDRFKAIVDHATLNRGMHVIIEPWQADPSGGAGGARWRGNLVGSGAVPVAAWSDFWGRMAALFADNPRVGFGLVNEPNNMSTMGWWAIAQAGIGAIRNAGAGNRIYVPGNGYSAASTWVIDNAFYDTDAVKRSNAYGFLNANGPGQPIQDPLNNFAVEVHTYLDADQGGSSTGITSATAAREHLEVVVQEARLRGYKVYLGEIGFLATHALGPAAWADFSAYARANGDVLLGYTWWAGGAPGWWDDVGASGGGHFSITPTNGATFTGDTVNMDLIENG